jgi:hypothetical protein
MSSPRQKMVLVASPQPNELEQKRKRQTLERAKANHVCLVFFAPAVRSPRPALETTPDASAVRQTQGRVRLGALTVARSPTRAHRCARTSNDKTSTRSRTSTFTTHTSGACDRRSDPTVRSWPIHLARPCSPRRTSSRPQHCRRPTTCLCQPPSPRPQNTWTADLCHSPSHRPPWTCPTRVYVWHRGRASHRPKHSPYPHPPSPSLPPRAIHSPALPCPRSPPAHRRSSLHPRHTTPPSRRPPPHRPPPSLSLYPPRPYPRQPPSPPPH